MIACMIRLIRSAMIACMIRLIHATVIARMIDMASVAGSCLFDEFCLMLFLLIASTLMVGVLYRFFFCIFGRIIRISLVSFKKLIRARKIILSGFNGHIILKVGWF